MKRKEKPNDVRDFSFALGAILAGVGAFRMWKAMGFDWPFIAAGAVIALLGLFAKPVMHPVFKGGMWVADKISWVMTRVILTILYVIVFVPYGLFFRLIRKDLLDRRLHRDWPSYWQPKKRREMPTKDRLGRLFI